MMTLHRGDASLADIQMVITDLTWRVIAILVVQHLLMLLALEGALCQLRHMHLTWLVRARCNASIDEVLLLHTHLILYVFLVLSMECLVCLQELVETLVELVVNQA